MVYFACDHRGFALKEVLKAFLAEQGYVAEDVGAFVYNKDDDYVDFARLAVEKIAQNPEEHKGILICGSGHGMDMAANKYKGIRAALCLNTSVAVQSREHENANVLVLASDLVSLDLAKEIVSAWLNTTFTGEERNVRRLKKVGDIEQQNFKN